MRVDDSRGRLLRLTLTPDGKYRLWTPIDQIPADLVTATLCYEDQYYWRHPGINPVAALRAAWHFCWTRTARGGASTISMQLARLCYHLNTRTVFGKLEQMWRALEIERHCTKSQILEAYFNLAPYGHNIEGVGAAGLLYFGKPAASLTLHEAVALSVIPQSPARRTPQVEAPNDVLTQAERRLLARLAPIGNRWVEAASDEFTPRAVALKTVVAAPHFVRAILGKAPPARVVATTLDFDLQRLLEDRIHFFLEQRRAQGVQNAAAMLVDTRSMSVLAQVGSADFFDAKIDGQMDGCRSRRSPGSTLKPFIYALAMEQGLIHPLSILEDAPRRFGAYTPENFDGGFVGPITATDALVRSRNLPAVDLADKLSHPTLYQWLRQGGVELPREESYYGLALPLGDGEVTMEELVRLYAALANGGRLRPLQRTLPLSAEGISGGRRLLSPEAAFLTLEMLSHNPRPGMDAASSNGDVCWKTGTSQGFHDAWSIGVFDHYVLAVWVGNFDGRRNPAFIGRTCAGPLFFQVVDALTVRGLARLAPPEPPPGANLRRTELCAVSGEIPADACQHHVSGWFIPGVSPIRSCEIHREVLIDVESGLRVSVDDGSRRLRREIFEFWPSNLLELFEQAGMPRRRPPPFLPESEGQIERLARGGKPPRIVSPQVERAYELTSGAGRDNAIPLRAQTDGDVAKLYWFANRAFVGAGSPSEALAWHPAHGRYTITALDDHGRSASGVVTVD